MTELVGGANATEDTVMVDENALKDFKFSEYNPYAGEGCCEHLKEKYPGDHPQTFTVRVAAKLSLAGDRHLEREAQVYQRFPDHLSDHYTGFNACYPFHNPVPATAVVPNFYAYYVPESTKEKKYLSPILLYGASGALKILCL
jgi:hypothetical protein